MTIETLFVVIIVLVIGIAWITLPFLRNKQSEKATQLRSRQRERLLAYYEQALFSARDLDEDFSTGKIQSFDYEREREVWMQHGVQVLRALEQLDGESVFEPAAPLNGEHGEDIDEIIEAMVAERLRDVKAR